MRVSRTAGPLRSTAELPAFQLSRHPFKVFCVDRCLRRPEPMGRQTFSSLLSVRCNGSFASLVMRQPVVDKQMRW